jgi:hypothetical protein
MLVMMAYVQLQGWVPQYVVKYNNEWACQAVAEKYPGNSVYKQKAVCLPQADK